MKFRQSRLAAAAAGFIITTSIGFGTSSAFAESSDQTDTSGPRFTTEIGQQIETGSREPVLTRMTGPTQLEGLDKSKDSETMNNTAGAMVMTLDDRISNHAEVVSLRQDLGTEIQNRFQEDVVLNQRIDNLLGTVSGQGDRIQSNRNLIGASQSDLNRIERRANDAYTLGGDAMNRANEAYNLADTANYKAGRAQNRADSAYSLAQEAKRAAKSGIVGETYSYTQGYGTIRFHRLISY